MSNFRSAPTADPRNAQAAFEFGLRARENGTERIALPVLRAASIANPHHPGLWQVLGLLYRALDELERAVHAFRKAAELAPNDALIAHGYARTVMEAGLPAKHLFDLAHSLAPADGSVLIGRSAAQLAQGDIDNAISDLEAVLHRNAAWQEGHSALSRLRWMVGDHARFTASLDRALEQTPNSPLLWSQLILTRMQAKQYRDVLDAIAAARVALKIPDAFLFIEACSVAELDLTIDADRLFKVIGNDNNAMIIEHKIRHLLRAGRPDEARDFADPFLEGPTRNVVLPYAYVAWRLLSDSRWDDVANAPHLLGIYDISDQLPSLDELADILLGLHVSQHEPLEQSLRGGTQTDGPLLSNIAPSIQHLRRAICEVTQSHVGKMQGIAEPGRGAMPEIRFAGSWSVRLRGAGHHANHIHQAGILSSALYISLPTQQEMGPAPAGWFTLGQPPEELKTGLHPIRTVEPKPGRLVLFPSTMWHGTNSIAAGERLTVAFDIASTPHAPPMPTD
jgi:tetratricopeptide (TPR) repeat protein